MIGIRSYSEDILKFLPQANIPRHRILLNPSTTIGLSCLVEIGGEGVRNTHGYVQLEGSLPIIQCLDPKTIHAESVNKMWILNALSKAQRIDTIGYKPPVIFPHLNPTLADIDAFVASIPDDALLSVDIECDQSTHEITVFGFAFQSERGIKVISIPLASENTDYWLPEDEARVWQIVESLLSNSNPKLFQNFIFDTMMFSYYGI